LKIHIIAVGKIKDKIIQAKINHYLDELKHISGKGMEIKLKQAPDGKSSAVEIKKKEEAEKILEALPSRAYLVVMDERGENLTSMEFAKMIERITEQGKELIFVLGGAYGLDEQVKEKADKVIAMSRLTFPHELARLILVEQLYRAFAIIKRTPYHH